MRERQAERERHDQDQLDQGVPCACAPDCLQPSDCGCSPRRASVPLRSVGLLAARLRLPRPRRLLLGSASALGLLRPRLALGVSALPRRASALRLGLSGSASASRGAASSPARGLRDRSRRPPGGSRGISRSARAAADPAAQVVELRAAHLAAGRSTSMRSILGECIGNVRSTPTPNDSLRTVNVRRAPRALRLQHHALEHLRAAPSALHDLEVDAHPVAHPKRPESGAPAGARRFRSSRSCEEIAAGTFERAAPAEQSARAADVSDVARRALAPAPAASCGPARDAPKAALRARPSPGRTAGRV